MMVVIMLKLMTIATQYRPIYVGKGFGIKESVRL